MNEVIEGEGDKQKITAKAVKARLKIIGKDPDYGDERAALAVDRSAGWPSKGSRPSCRQRPSASASRPKYAPLMVPGTVMCFLNDDL